MPSQDTPTDPLGSTPLKDQTLEDLLDIASALVGVMPDDEGEDVKRNVRDFHERQEKFVLEITNSQWAMWGNLSRSVRSILPTKEGTFVSIIKDLEEDLELVQSMANCWSDTWKVICPEKLAEFKNDVVSFIESHRSESVEDTPKQTTDVDSKPARNDNTEDPQETSSRVA